MDEILRIYTRLVALGKSLREAKRIEERYVNEYNGIVGLLSQETNSPLGEFKIPDNALQRYVTFATSRHTSYSDKRYCEPELFFSKSDALLLYFSIKHLSSEKEKPEIGFTNK